MAGILPSAADLTLTVGSTNGSTGAQVLVPIRVAGFVNISTLQFSMHWDPAVASYGGVEQFALPTLAFNNFPNGTLIMSWDDPETVGKSLADGTVLFFLRLRLSDNPGGPSAVLINGNPVQVEAYDIDLNFVPVTVVNGTITINVQPPAIITHPQDQTADVGTNVTFSVVAAGSAPLSYQWRKNGFALAGATSSSLLLTNIQLVSAGDYSVVVANAGGAVTSAVARLTVTIPRDTTPPGIIITSPTATSTLSVTNNILSIAGIADDNIGVTSVTWTNSRGGSGTATGTTNWSVSGISLQLGENIIIVRATDAEANANTDTLTVTYNLPPDITPPTVIITSPTSLPTLSVDTNALALAGVADDNTAVVEVTWRNDRGGSGTAAGTDNWSISAVILQGGANVITVTARDSANNTNSDSLTVTYTPPPDTTPPVAIITSPTQLPTLSIGTNNLSLAGTATDNVGVTTVSWFNDRGGSGTATGTTNWSITGIRLQGGDNALTVIALDAAGNAGLDTLTITYTPPEDTNAPVVSITSPTGQPTFSTTTNSVSLAGIATDNIAVTAVSWNNNRGGSGAATGTDVWSIAGVGLQLGTNVITVTATDEAGNPGVDTLIITYTPPPDTTLPVVNITSPTDQPALSINTNILSLTGTATDNVAVTAVSWSNNRGGNGTASGTNNWSVSGVVLQLGTNVITVLATDAAGNTGTDTLTVTYTPPPDTTSPIVIITSPTASPTFLSTNGTLPLSGIADDNVGVTQVVWTNSSGGGGLASGRNDWSINAVVLRLGENVLTVSASDAAGNVGTDTLVVTYQPPPDTTAPSITITSPTSSPSLLVSNNNTVSLAGTANDNVGVTQVTWHSSRGSSGTAAGTNNWSVALIQLEIGENVLTVTARDAAGNTNTDSLTITYTNLTDTTAPVVTITSPTSEPTLTVNNNILSLAGSANDNVGVRRVIWNNNRGGSGTATGTNTWSVSGILLQTGDNVLTVTAFDAATNSSADTLTVNFNGPTGAVTSVSGRLLYYPTSSHSVPDATINASGSADLNTQTASNGTYTLSLSVGGNYIVQPLAPTHGPAAEDVTTLDLSLIRRHLVAGIPLDSPYKLLAADVNGSRTLSSLDITTLRRLVLGATDTLPSGLWRFVRSDHVFGNPDNPWVSEIPSSRAYNNLAGPIVNQDFYAIKIGDVNSSWDPCLTGEPCAIPPALTNEVSFVVSSHTNQPGEMVAVTVTVKDFRDVTSIQFTLGWETSALRYRSVSAFGLTGLSAQNFNSAQTASGKLSVSWDDQTGGSTTLPDGAAIFTITFDVVASTLGASQVVFLDGSGALPSREVGINFQTAAFQSGNGYVLVLTDSGPPIDPSTINYDVTTFSILTPTVAGWHYVLEHTDSLSVVPLQWQALPAVVGDGTLKALIDPSATSQQRFYRLRIEPR